MPSPLPRSPAVGVDMLPSHLLGLVFEQPPSGVGPDAPASVNETLLLGTGFVPLQQPPSGAVSW